MELNVKSYALYYFQTQYYIAVNGQSAIYIGTYTTAEPSIGELRFIARLSKSAVPRGYTQSEISGKHIISSSHLRQYLTRKSQGALLLRLAMSTRSMGRHVPSSIHLFSS